MTLTPHLIMNQTELTERPTILTWGIILMAAKSAFFLLLLMIGLVGVPIIFGIGAVEERGDDAFAIVLVGCFIEFIVFLFALLQVVALYACKRAWENSRNWLIVLMVLAGLSALDSGPIGLAVAGLTIVGGIQLMERTKEEASPEPQPEAPAA